MSILSDIDKKVDDAIAEKARSVMKAVLAEAPLLDAILDGKQIEISITIQLRRKE